MTHILRRSALLSTSVLLATLLVVPLSLVVALAASAQTGKVVPLPPDVAKDLELFGEGVVGKPVPAPKLEDLNDYYLKTLGGTWNYKIVSGKDEGKIREEVIEPIAKKGGNPAWRQDIGGQFAQYMQLLSDGSFGKYGEDDLSVGYGAHFHPGVVLPPGGEPGQSYTYTSKVLAYKLGDVNDISYTGEMKTTGTYVGAYQVTTPAGTWPAVLIRAEFDVEIGPAKVKDTTYSFFVKDVGKVAEIEGLRVSALFVYHSDDKTAKVLAELPDHLKKK
jgi:hypothetical protein